MMRLNDVITALERESAALHQATYRWVLSGDLCDRQAAAEHALRCAELCDAVGRVSRNLYRYLSCDETENEDAHTR